MHSDKAFYASCLSEGLTQQNAVKTKNLKQRILRGLSNQWGKTSSHNLDKTSGSGEEEGWREEENLENGVLGGSASCPPFAEFQGKKKKKNYS